MATSPQPSFLNPRGSTAIADSNDGFDIFQARAGNVLLWYVRNDGSIVFPDGSVQSTASTGGSLSLAAFGSTPNANGGSVSGSVLTLQPADTTHPGGVSTAAQSFGGVKTLVAGAVAGVRGTSDGVGFRAEGQQNLDAFLGTDASTGFPGLWFGATPGSESTANYALLIADNTELFINTPGNTVQIRLANAPVASFNATQLDLSAAGSNPTNKLTVGYTDISGTPGAGVADTASGRFAVVNASAAPFTVTCTPCTTTSVVQVTQETVGCGKPLLIVPGAGSFTVTPNETPSAAAKFRFVVFN